METKEEIEYPEFLEIQKKLDIRIGKIFSAERVPKSDKLLMLKVRFTLNDESEKTCVTNIGQFVEPETLLGLTSPFIVNLKPSKMMGITSEVMIMVGTDEKDNIQIGLDYFGIGSKLL